QEASPAIVDPHRIEIPFLNDQFQEDPPKDPPEVPMMDNRTMVEMLRAPIEGYAEAIVVPSILAEQFELKHSLINMMTSKQFFRLKKDNLHDHIRAAHRWLEKEPWLSITTRKDLVSKFIDEFFPPSRTTSLRNKISKFEQKFGEFFHEAWDRYKDVLRTCPHHGFTELHQLNTFYNGLNPTDQDSLNAAAGGNLLERSTQDMLTIIENKSKLTHAINEQTSAMTTAMTAMLRQFQATPPPAPIKAVKEKCVTCGAMLNQIDMVKNKLRNEMKTSIQTSLSNQTNKVSAMMASLLQMNTASPSSSSTLPSNTVANPKSDLKAITTRSGVSYNGPLISPPVVENAPEANKDTMIPTNNGNTEDVQPQAVSSKPPISTSKPANTPTGRALINVFEGELTLRAGKEAITFNLDQTSRDILLLEAFLNDDPSSPPLNQRNSLLEVSKELKICKAKTKKSSVDEPPVVELKALTCYHCKRLKCGGKGCSHNGFKETDTQEKDKNKAQNDKTKHRMEKIEKYKVIRSRRLKVKAQRQQKSTPGKPKFLKSLFARFGAPRAIISDRGTYFCNEQFTKVMLKYGVMHRLSTAYHLQTSGQVEDCSNCEVFYALSIVLYLQELHILSFILGIQVLGLRVDLALWTFGGNDATKKTKKNQLKQQYGNFKVEGSETLEQPFNRVQAIVSHLEFMDVKIKQDDLNQKFLTSLAPEWLIYTIVWRNRDDLDTMSLDDVGNGAVHTASVPTACTQVFTASIDVSAASLSHDTVCAYIASQSNDSQIKYEDITQIDEDDIEEIDIKWNIALSSIRADSYMANEEENHALVADEKVPTEFALMAKSSSSSENKVESRLVKFKEQEIKFCEKFRGLERDVEVRNNKIEYLTNELEEAKKEKESLDNKLTGSIMSKPMIKSIKAADCLRVSKTNNIENTRKSNVKYAEMYRNTSKSPKDRGNQCKWNNLKSQQLGKDFLMQNKACFKCGYFDHLASNCGVWADNWEPWPNNNYAHKNVTPKVVLLKTGRTPIRVNRPNMNVVQPKMTSFAKTKHSNNNIDDKGYWDNGCSRHMTGNISYLFEYEPYDGGYVSFRQGGGKIRTGIIKLASVDESMLWHRRLGHLNFKTMNKLVRNNLVKGLPSKCFENDHTCVACLKGKQHKASCKTKFTWTFFLRTKDETSSILRNFITEIENLKDLKVKIIRTLIEATRTMLADAKLPVTFWAEAVNTACYVQNSVLVHKSQNKTPYELFNSRTHAIGFIRPFGCHVMILNTLDHLGKFDAKGDEGYFVGYSLSSKAFRVFNKRTKKVEENLHVDFLENKLIEKGAGPNWLFDIDTLTNFMNYVPVVVAGTSSTNISAHMDTKNCDASDGCNADVPENSGIFNPTANISPESSSGLRLISKGDFSQKETPSLGNALTLSNRFEDSFREEADLSNMETSIPEEGIDYEEVFAPVARIEAIRLFLAYTSFMGFTVYQMDVKSAFLYGTINYEKDGIFLSQDNYVGDIIKKFGYSDVRLTNTPVDKENPWGKDGPSKDVELHLYRSMIGSLMYLTASRPDIMFAVCACTRHQVTRKECHLHAVKRIFRYLKGHPKLGLWYPKESPFDLMAYLDSDYGGATQDRKSTTEGYQFLGRRLISWQCKKQTIVTTSITKAEYVAAVSGCDGSSTPTESYHTPCPQEQHSPHHDPSSPSHPTTTTEPIPQTPTETPTLRRYSRRAIRIAQSKALSLAADEPASLLIDDR
nr:uncharacterized mitochondrial protein AtMg00810-like [Tanacetum cinerariifolium]